jgi:hypothetical protein
VAALGDGIPCFLRAEQCLVNREWCGLAPETDTLLLQAARRIVDDQPLRLLAWHCQRLLYDHPDYENLARWPSLEGAMGDLSGVFYLLVTMAMVPRIKSIHESMSVPEQVTRDTCSQISCVTGNYRRMTSGRLGVTLNTLHWLRIYAAGRLFRIGRMEYMLGPFPGGPSVYQHHETGETIALASDGVRYDEEGYLVTVDDRAIEGRCWTATLASEGGLIVGHPVSPYGMALRQQVALWGSEWECVLKPGDPVLDMHIPAGGGMTLDKCKDSMRQAVCFFRKHFPDRRFRAIASVSWIFGTQLVLLR